MPGQVEGSNMTSPQGYDPTGHNWAPLQISPIQTDASNNENYGMLLVAPSQTGYIALVSPPAATGVGADTTFTFAQQVNTVVIQNNTSATVNFAFDTAASAGSLALAAGNMIVYQKKVTAVHLFTAAAQNVNGTTTGNIVLLGEL